MCLKFSNSNNDVDDDDDGQDFKKPANKIESTTQFKHILNTIYLSLCVSQIIERRFNDNFRQQN